MAANKQIKDLNQVTSDFTHVYFVDCTSLTNNELTSTNLLAKAAAPDFEFPVIEGSINYSLGATSEEYIKLSTGAIWGVKRSKDDPDISFNVASNNSAVSELFATKKKTMQSVVTPTTDTQFKVAGYDTATVKVVYGALIFTDDAGNADILPKCEITGTRGKESVAYWAIKVIPKTNSEGVNLYTTIES